MTMVPAWLRFVMAAFCAGSAVGCGTFVNFEKGGLDNPKIYGGVVHSTEMVRNWAESDPNVNYSGLMCAFYVADVPVSFVADTLTLPITATTTLIHATSANVQDKK